MSEAPEYEIAEDYYTAEGVKVRLVAITTEGEFIVSKYLEQYDQYGDTYEYVGPVDIVAAIFAKPPVEVVDAEIAKRKAELAEIEAKHSKLFCETLDVERAAKDRLAKFSKFKGLELLEDFIDKKITHFVFTSSEHDLDFKIGSFEEAIESLDRDKKDLRLVTLFGRSNGDLQWRVDRYYDGSGGSNQHTWPCRDEQHAKDTIVAIISDRLDWHFKHIRPDRDSYWFLRTYEAAIKYGIVPTPEQEAKYRELKAASLAGQITGAKKNLETAQAALEKLIEEQERFPA